MCSAICCLVLSAFSMPLVVIQAAHVVVALVISKSCSLCGSYDSGFFMFATAARLALQHFSCMCHRQRLLHHCQTACL